MHIRRQLSALLLMAGLTISCASKGADDTLLAEYNYYESGKIELNEGNYQQAITHYDNLQKLYPKSPYIPQAQLESAYAYYKLGDADHAIDKLQWFLQKENRHTHKPYAFYLAGLARYQEALHLMESATTSEGNDRARTAAKQAINYFSQLVDKFPESLYSDDAKQKTTYLLEKMVLHRIKSEEQIVNQDRQKRIKSESNQTQAWLMKQPAGSFTLELVRSPDYDNAFKVALQYHLEKNAMIIETQTAEGDGYTLLYGIYSDKHQAMQAGASLPRAILKTQPQVRELSSVQAEIIESRLIDAGAKPPPKSTTSEQPPPPAEAAKSAIDFENRTPQERWLLSQSPNAYTVQLMGASNEENIMAFINDNNLAGQAFYYRSRRKDGSSWYSLVYGSYPNKSSAIEASAKIGAQLGIAQPWIRSFRGIHKDINSSN